MTMSLAFSATGRLGGALPRRVARRGFSLVEVLLAIFILGIGLIMVASVFPVGANWTRQTTEESVGQTIALDAVSVIKEHYGPTGDLHYSTDLSNVGGPKAMDPDAFSGGVNGNTILKSADPFRLQALPWFTRIPVTERAYQFGSNIPFPAKNPQACTYFWTAVGRLDPSHAVPNTNKVILSSSYKYDIYILVFHKGSAEQKFSFNYQSPGNGEMPGTRYFEGAGSANSEGYVPSVYCTSQSGAVLPGFSGNPNGPALPVGAVGIGQATGTVFHTIVSNAGTTAPLPTLGVDPDSGSAENVIWSCPADGTVASPLIYVYQTTLTF